MESTVKLAEEKNSNKPTIEGFYQLKKNLLAEEFKVIGSDDIRRVRYQFGIQSITLHPGRETGFRYSHLGYTVRVWPSFDEARQEYRERDNGFVLIARNSDNYVVYWGPVMRRTKNFTDNIFLMAKKCKQLVLGIRPCPDRECRQFMHIVPGRGGKGKMYACMNDTYHGRGHGPTMNFHHGLDPEMKALSKRVAKARKRDANDPRRKSARGSGFGNRKPRHKQTFTPAVV